MKRAIVWLRQDLRLSDNPALYQACIECDEVFPLFIDDSNDNTISQSPSNIGCASSVWLHHSLKKLDIDLKTHNSQLFLRQGNAFETLERFAQDIEATHIYWNRCYEPEIRGRDEIIKSTLKNIYEVKSFKGNLLLEPWQVLKQDETPYRVFTPFWKMLIKTYIPSLPLPIPSTLKAPLKTPEYLGLNDLGFLPQPPIPRWDLELMETWSVGETSAHGAFHTFLESVVNDYKEQRDFPAIDATTRLSAHLHFGEISPTQLFHYGYSHKAKKPNDEQGVDHILRQVVWREFAHYLLYHYPQTVTQPLYEKYEAFEWREDDEHLERWQKGMTGFPIIDAGMRQLYKTGWMHNRIRMISSSFLCKNLLIHWRTGESWFRDTLIDADIANNTMGWQWVAGCGADAAPYYRIFNPLLQSKKFDKEADYIRKWVPELAQLDDKNIHEPTEKQAKQCGYPTQVVDLKATRARALERYSRIK